MALLNHNSVALITASSAGLGAETARVLASSGVRVIINYNSSDQKALSLIKELETLQPVSTGNERQNPRFHAIKADVSQKAELVRLVEEAVEWTKLRNFLDLDDNMEEGDWDKCFNMNVKSHLFLFHAARKHLENTEGSFITTASLAGVMPSGSSIAYSVTKAAQIHLAKALAMAAAPKIRVNSVSPGLLLTEWGLQFPQDKIDQTTERSLLKRVAIVEDVARQIVCLANSSSQTGTNTVIDGGRALG
ncbi:NAD(P)-binding Rossmann-fold containing protein [Venustampulla echinocandica]|uniref:NAD(P)-binding Rossmann-fold containing protein n=1 Tax=Venustampulla echinocandica TaxID=2656787 RepID=A0A370TXM7_9HELO|nr:NAD(P)-binding Rossmann-fold containing protein [Venustampulla echinocandica]RDL40287.1 NAD(P)-binding Rossmann-fold containing protein [Venustampulla echinocandica]